MMSKETFIAWLYEHGKLTADLEFDVHDCFDAALDAATSALGSMPGIGFMSPKKRLNSFYTVCRFLDGLVKRGSLEANEALVAVNILRALDKDFNKAAGTFEHRASGADSSTLPLVAREYLAASTEAHTPLVAG